MLVEFLASTFGIAKSSIETLSGDVREAKYFCSGEFNLACNRGRCPIDEALIYLLGFSAGARKACSTASTARSR